MNVVPSGKTETVTWNASTVLGAKDGSAKAVPGMKVRFPALAYADTSYIKGIRFVPRTPWKQSPGIKYLLLTLSQPDSTVIVNQAPGSFFSLETQAAIFPKTRFQRPPKQFVPGMLIDPFQCWLEFTRDIDFAIVVNEFHMEIEYY